MSLKMLGIRYHTSSVYHPESQGGLRGISLNLKEYDENPLSLKKEAVESDNIVGSHSLIPFLLFAVGDAKRESLDFSTLHLFIATLFEDHLNWWKTNGLLKKVRQLFYITFKVQREALRDLDINQGKPEGKSR